MAANSVSFSLNIVIVSGHQTSVEEADMVGWKQARDAILHD